MIPVDFRLESRKILARKEARTRENMNKEVIIVRAKVHAYEHMPYKQ